MEKKPDFIEWLKTEAGIDCLKWPISEPKYLQNRLFWAFDAGRTHVWDQYLQIKSQLSELQEANETLDKLMRSGEQRGHDTAEEHFKSKLLAIEEKHKQEFEEYTQAYQLKQSETTNALYKELSSLQSQLSEAEKRITELEKLSADDDHTILTLEDQLKQSQSQNERLLSALKDVCNSNRSDLEATIEEAQQLINEIEKQ